MAVPYLMTQTSLIASVRVNGAVGVIAGGCLPRANNITRRAGL